jgi:hypothetical protein
VSDLCAILLRHRHPGESRYSDPSGILCFVIPAKAGIQLLGSQKTKRDYSPLLRPALRAAFGVRFGILPAQSGSSEARSVLSLSKGRNDGSSFNILQAKPDRCLQP